MYKNIKNLLFDFGGVIVSLDKKNALNAFRDLGIANIEEYLNEFRQSGIFLEYEEGKLDAPQFYKALRELAGNQDITEEQIDLAWQAFAIGIPDYKYKMLKELRKSYNVYLLSNTNPSMAKWMYSEDFSPTKEPIDAFFDKCYLSFEIGHAKPEKAIYEYIINDSGINPAETLFFDDGEANLKAAQELGFQTYLTDQNEDLTKVIAQIEK
ncbi:HAD family phosphatase [Dysgonomonas sp. 25]|uniref:HAD family hydrolase n=1 Tax=Dysgonomonas sp. 25 TaxID=2302933 RepID=UPI0013D23D04|nr:HAD family phosphatase [Dysgonomonas sp. 25]NDV68017.1 HAD family phosphatase [Dysgonomonas sp. 25]